MNITHMRQKTRITMNHLSSETTYLQGLIQ